MVHRYSWSSQSHQRHILSPGTSARRDAPSTAVTTKRTTRRDGWSCSLNHCNSPTYHYHNYITKAITGLPPRRLLQTSRLHPGLHSTGGKKTILPSLLLLLRLLFFISRLHHTQTAVPRALHHRHQSAVTLPIYGWRG